MAADGDAPAPQRRAIRRDEGEVSQWPRGLVDYVPRGPADDGRPPEEEDRTAQRLLLAARLIAVLRERQVDVAPLVDRLRLADAAYRAGDRPRATRLVDELIGELGDRASVEFPRTPGDR